MKSKWLFIGGIIMLPLLIAYIFLGINLSVRSLWPYYATLWIVLYILSAIIMLVFLVYAALKLRDLIKNSNGSRVNSLAGIFAGVGCALLTFAICFVWYAINHPEMDAPLSLTVTHAIYNIYAVITVALLLGAILLKIILGYTKISEYIKARKAKK